MKITIDIQNCQECPFSWSHTGHSGDTTWVCDKLHDNIGAGNTISDRCPAKGE